MQPHLWTPPCCLFWLCLNLSPLAAHRDPCHRWHSCPSDHVTYTCGDKGRCNQCPDNAYCLNRQPRASTLAPTPSVDTPPTPARQAPFIGAVVGLADGGKAGVVERSACAGAVGVAEVAEAHNALVFAL